MVKTEDIIPSDLDDNGRIFLNGRWVGIHTNPPLLYKIMKLLKVNSIINVLTSISWNSELNELYIFCDSGRIVRPVFLLKEDRSNELISGSLERMDNWSHLTHGYMYTQNPDISPYDNTYYRNELVKLKESGDFMKTLEKEQAPIEYIDSTESNYSFIAPHYRSIDILIVKLNRV
jgi:hypothetical protein